LTNNAFGAFDEMLARKDLFLQLLRFISGGRHGTLQPLYLVPDVSQFRDEKGTMRALLVGTAQ
jgi:hypothetical protein